MGTYVFEMSVKATIQRCILCAYVLKLYYCRVSELHSGHAHKQGALEMRIPGTCVPVLLYTIFTFLSRTEIEINKYFI